jgi:putative oxidoreductase
MKAGEAVFALMRVIVGVLWLCHGAQKVLGAFPDGKGTPVLWQGGQDLLDGVLIKPRLTLFGALALLLGFLIAIGLFARIAGLIASAEMAVNYVMFHAGAGFWPIVNHGELAMLYCFIFLYVAARGAGRYSADALRSATPGARGS